MREIVHIQASATAGPAPAARPPPIGSEQPGPGIGARCLPAQPGAVGQLSGGREASPAPLTPSRPSPAAGRPVQVGLIAVGARRGQWRGNWGTLLPRLLLLPGSSGRPFRSRCSALPLLCESYRACTAYWFGANKMRLSRGEERRRKQSQSALSAQGLRALPAAAEAGVQAPGVGCRKSKRRRIKTWHEKRDWTDGTARQKKGGECRGSVYTVQGGAGAWGRAAQGPPAPPPPPAVPAPGQSVGRRLRPAANVVWRTGSNRGTILRAGAWAPPRGGAQMGD